MKMQYVDVLSDRRIQGFSIVDIESDLQTYYTMLHCDTIEMPIYDIDGHKLIVICDEEGSLKDNRVMSGINPYGQPLYGNLLICGCTHGEDGIEECGLTDEDMKILDGRFGATLSSDGHIIPCIDLRSRNN